MEARWRRSVKGAVHWFPSCQQRLLHKHQVKQQFGSGHVFPTNTWSGSSLNTLDSSTSPRRFEKYFSCSCLFFVLFLFRAGEVLQIRKKSSRWRRFLIISWSCSPAASLKHMSHKFQRKPFNTYENVSSNCIPQQVFIQHSTIDRTFHTDNCGNTYFLEEVQNVFAKWTEDLLTPDSTGWRKLLFSLLITVAGA